MDYWNVYQRGDYLMSKLSQACNFCNNTSEHCCPEADKNYEAEQAKRERELREEDELFNSELARLGFGPDGRKW